MTTIASLNTTVPPVSLAKYLQQAIRDGNQATIDSVLKQGANPNEYDDDGMTAMHLASHKGDRLALIKMVNAGGDVSIQHKVNKSQPIHFAAEIGDKECVNYLLDAEAEIDAVNEYQATPLIYACLGNHYSLVRFLLKKSAKTDLRLKWGANARAISVLKGYHKCAALLPADPFSEEFIRRKTLAHFNGIADKSELDGTEFDLTGAFAPHMHHEISKSLTTYFASEESPFSAVAERKLIVAYSKAARPKTTGQILAEVHKGRLIILPAQWTRHAIDLVFFKIGQNF